MTEPKACRKCGDTKPATEFYRHRAMASRRLNECRSCTTKAALDWRNKPANRARWNLIRHFRNLEKRFGISRAQFDALYTNPICAGCGVTKSRNGRRLALDHDHKTGKMRGLLCHECNRTIATAKDDPAILRALAQYLEDTCF